MGPRSLSIAPPGSRHDLRLNRGIEREIDGRISVFRFFVLFHQNLQVDIRIALLEIDDETGDQMRSGAKGKAHGRLYRAAALFDFFFRRRKLDPNALGVEFQNLPVARRDDIAPAFLKKRRVQFFFQRFDRARERRLRDVELGGRFRQMLHVRAFQEIFQCQECRFHGGPLSLEV